MQGTVKRVDFAFQRFFKGLSKYPKFKSIRQYSGWTFPDKLSWNALTKGKHGQLHITNLGKIRMRGKARTWGLPTTCTIVYRPSVNKWYHKLTSNTVRRNSLIAGENLNVTGMTARAKQGKRKKQKAGLNRSILSVGFGIVGPMLDYKSAEAGGFHLESPTQQLKLSQRCAECWELTPKTLKDRVHVCSNPACGHIEDRDVNADHLGMGPGTWPRKRGVAKLYFLRKHEVTWDEEAPKIPLEGRGNPAFSKGGVVHLDHYPAGGITPASQ